MIASILDSEIFSAIKTKVKKLLKKRLTFKSYVTQSRENHLKLGGFYLVVCLSIWACFFEASFVQTLVAFLMSITCLIQGYLAGIKKGNTHE